MAKIKTVYKKTRPKKRDSFTTTNYVPISKLLATQPAPVIATDSPVITPTVSPASATMANAVIVPTPVTMNPGTIPESQPLITPVMPVAPVTTVAPITPSTVAPSVANIIPPAFIRNDGTAQPSINDVLSQAALPTAQQANNNILLYLVLALVGIYILVYLMVGAKKS